VAVSSAKRLASLPDVPTLVEIGYPDMVTTTWHMLTSPAGMPRDIVGMLNREVIAIMDRPHMRKHFEIDAVETMALTPGQLTQFVRRESEKWGPVARVAAKVD
jgi:tripartite-type tricarboxylate transporter receptor subunit TctC